MIKHTTQVRVRYAETDKMGFVYNGNYLTYFEVGRVELMRHFNLSYADLENCGYYLPLVDSYVKYVKSAFYDDLLDIEATLDWDTKPILRFNYRIIRNGELVAEGYTTHCFLNKETMKPVKPPQIFIDAINKLKRSA
jgi:acyl-CoA thioester hydrolase